MKPQSPPPQRELFAAHLSKTLNHEQLFYVYSERIDWHQFELAIDQCNAEELGRPGIITRMIVGLLYLKHALKETN